MQSEPERIRTPRPQGVGEGTAAEGGGRGWISPPCKASLKGSVPHDRREWGKVPPPKAGVGGWISPPCKASLKGSVPHAKQGGRYRRRRRGGGVCRTHPIPPALPGG